MKRIVLASLFSIVCVTPILAATPKPADDVKNVAPTNHALPQVESAFSPEGGAEALVHKVINNSVSKIRLAAYSFNSHRIASALVSAKQRGVDVEVLVDARRNNHKNSIAALNMLVDAGIQTRTISAFAMHHDKYIISDDTSVQNGSFNYSKDAAVSNSENVVVFWNNPELAASFLAHWQDRWSRGTAYKK